jgi:hypothetical protein
MTDRTTINADRLAVILTATSFSYLVVRIGLAFV